MAKINFTPDALEDMKEIKAYITDELCSEQSAINTIEKIMKRIRQLADFPEIGIFPRKHRYTAGTDNFLDFFFRLPYHSQAL